jgi:precorrin-2 methylase
MDSVVEIKWARGAVNAFVEQGDKAVLHEYPVGHTISADMRRDLWSEIAKAIDQRP